MINDDVTNLKPTAADAAALHDQSQAGEFQARSVTLISTAHAIHDSYTGSLPALLPVLIETIGITKSQAGILGIFINIPSLLQPLIGYLADHTNLRSLIVVAPAVTAVFMSLVGVAPSYSIAVLLLLIVGISSASFHAVAPVVAGILSGKTLGRGMSYMMVGGEMGRTLGPLIVVTFLSVFEVWQMPYLMLYGLLASVLLYFRLKDLPQHQVNRPPASQSLTQSMRMMGPLLLPVAGYMSLRSLTLAAMTIFLPIYLTENGSTLLLAGASLTIFQAAGMAGALAGGSLSDVFGRRGVLLVSILVTPVLVLLFLFSSQWLGVILLILMGFFILSVTPVLMAIVQESFPENRSMANGSFMTISFLTNALGMVVIGIAGDRFGLQATYTASALLMFAAAPLVFLLPKNHSSSN